MLTPFLFWLIASFVFLIMETGSPGLFYFLSFFFGALVASFVGIYYNSFVVQGIVFFFGTSVSFAILNLLVKRYLQLSGKNYQTNVYALRGKRGIVLRTVDCDKSGMVKVGGEVWSARSSSEPIQPDMPIKVIAVRGSHLIVELIKNV